MAEIGGLGVYRGHSSDGGNSVVSEVEISSLPNLQWGMGGGYLTLSRLGKIPIPHTKKSLTPSRFWGIISPLPRQLAPTERINNVPTK